MNARRRPGSIFQSPTGHSPHTAPPPVSPPNTRAGTKRHLSGALRAFAAKPPNADWSASSMVALWPGEEPAQALLAWAGIEGDGVDELHVTILYLGAEGDDFPDSMRDQIADIARQAALDVFPDDLAMEGGTIRHMGNPDENDGYTAVAVEWDLDTGATGLSKQYREQVEAQLGEIGVTNASQYTEFRAHTTLTWLPVDDVPDHLADGTPVDIGLRIDVAGVVFGDDDKWFVRLDDRQAYGPDVDAAEQDEADAVEEDDAVEVVDAVVASAFVDELTDRADQYAERIYPILTTALDNEAADALARTLMAQGPGALTAAGGEGWLNAKQARDLADAAIAYERGDISANAFESAKTKASRAAAGNAAAGLPQPVVVDDTIVQWDAKSWAGARAEMAERVAESVYAEAVGLGLTWGPTSTQVLNVAEQHIALLDDLGDGARSHLSRHSARALTNGHGVEKMAREMATGGPFTRTTARRYSQTILLGATNQTNAQAYAATAQPGDEKEWSASLDSRVRDTHAAAHKQRVPVDGYFNVGGYDCFQPGDPVLPPQERINCLPGDTVVAVEGQLELLYRRSYEGPMITVKMESGLELTATPNHPAFRADGSEVPLGDVAEGDYLLRYVGPVEVPDRSANGVDDEHRPVTFEQVYDLGAERWPQVGHSGDRLDFHGDGSETDVDVVLVAGELVDADGAELLQRVDEIQFPPAVVAGSGLTGEGTGPLDVVAVGAAPAGSLSGADASLSLVAAGTSGADPVRRRLVTEVDAPVGKTFGDGGAGEAEPAGQGEHAFPGEVTGDKVVGVHVEPSWSGHVYNLQSSAGRYVANGMLVGNCRCTFLPVTALGKKYGIGGPGGSVDLPDDGGSSGSGSGGVSARTVLQASDRRPVPRTSGADDWIAEEAAARGISTEAADELYDVHRTMFRTGMYDIEDLQGFKAGDRAYDALSTQYGDAVAATPELAEYVGRNQYVQINRALREGSDEYADIAEAITTGMAPLDEGARVFRGVDLGDVFGDKQPADLVGTVFEDKGFTSTTLSKSYAEKWNPTGMLDIEVPAGSRGVFVSKDPTGQDQFELILAPKTKFRVLEVLDDGSIRVEVAG